MSTDLFAGVYRYRAGCAEAFGESSPCHKREKGHDRQLAGATRLIGGQNPLELFTSIYYLF